MSKQNRYSVQLCNNTDSADDECIVVMAKDYQSAVRQAREKCPQNFSLGAMYLLPKKAR